VSVLTEHAEVLIKLTADFESNKTQIGVELTRIDVKLRALQSRVGGNAKKAIRQLRDNINSYEETPEAKRVYQQFSFWKLFLARECGCKPKAPCVSAGKRTTPNFVAREAGDRPSVAHFMGLKHGWHNFPALTHGALRCHLLHRLRKKSQTENCWGLYSVQTNATCD
jgi:hypothetical protein